MAYFKQLKTKRWQVQIRRYGVKLVTKTFPTKSEAKIWANHIESEIDRGIYVSRYEAEHVTFSELIHRYQKEVTPYKKSASREISRLKCLNNFFGEISLARINSEMVARFRDERLFLNLSGSTVIKDLNTLSHIIDTAIKEWGCYLPSNPVKNIRKPKVNAPRSRRLSPEEELILFKERDLIPLLRYLKYLVDTMRKHNIVWGVGRGSSVASYILYLIGVHKINSIKCVNNWSRLNCVY